MRSRKVTLVECLLGNGRIKNSKPDGEGAFLSGNGFAESLDRLRLTSLPEELATGEVRSERATPEVTDDVRDAGSRRTFKRLVTCHTTSKCALVVMDKTSAG